jgi:two-component system, cell cycle response regulator DivK
MTGKTVLVVEDNDDSRDIYRTVLRHHGYDVRVAEDGEAALAAALAHPPDLVLLDLGLPGVDGVEVTRRLREEPATAHVPVLVLTVHSQPGDRADAHEAGCDRYLVKPADPRDVVAEIQRMLDALPAPAEE